MKPTRGALVAGATAWLARLRFPTLFLLTAIVFALDLVLLDGFPFLDEMVLALAAALLASWKKRRGDEPEPPTDDRVIDV